jgi:hypothetical protein
VVGGFIAQAILARTRDDADAADLAEGAAAPASEGRRGSRLSAPRGPTTGHPAE